LQSSGSVSLHAQGSIRTSHCAPRSTNPSHRSQLSQMDPWSQILPTTLPFLVSPKSSLQFLSVQLRFTKKAKLQFILWIRFLSSSLSNPLRQWSSTHNIRFLPRPTTTSFRKDVNNTNNLFIPTWQCHITTGSIERWRSK